MSGTATLTETQLREQQDDKDTPKELLNAYPPSTSLSKTNSIADNAAAAAKARTAVVKADGGEPGSDATDKDLARKTRRKEHLVYGAMCWALFLAGWNDGTTGPLIPRIQEVYGLNFLIVSLIFIFACLGFVTGSIANVYLTEKMKFGNIVILGSLCQVVAYAIQAPAPPFPVLVFAYVINGIGISVQDAQANGLVASIHTNAEEKMGVLHAIYGLGALCSPLAATQFAQMERWSFHFLISLGIAVSNTALQIFVTRGRSSEDILIDIGSPPTHVEPAVTPSRTSTDGEEADGTPERTNPVTEPQQEKSLYKEILTNKIVQLLAIYLLIYVGVEVTIGGWIVSFLIYERGGGPSSGYVSSGFFGGLTLGRVALLWVNRKVGERRVIFLYAIIAIGLELVIWFVPSLVGNAVAVSIVGMLLGPMYPIAMNHVGRVLPRKILAGSIGWMAGFGQAGSALLPFMTGALANRYGIKALQPLIVAMMAAMTVLWALVPGAPKRRE